MLQHEFYKKVMSDMGFEEEEYHLIEDYVRPIMISPDISEPEQCAVEFKFPDLIRGGFMTYKRKRNSSVSEFFTENYTNTRLQYPMLEMKGVTKSNNFKLKKYVKPQGTPERVNMAGLKAFFEGKYDQIEDLYICEGEKKAIAGCKRGLAVVAISGISSIAKVTRHPVTEEKVAVEIPEDIEELLSILPNLKSINLLHDADAFSGDRNRRKQFFAMVKNFTTAYYGRAKFLTYNAINHEEYKGLDDLLVAYRDMDIDQIVKYYIHTFPLNTTYDFQTLERKYQIAQRNKIDIMYDLIKDEGLRRNTISKRVESKGRNVTDSAMRALKFDLEARLNYDRVVNKKQPDIQKAMDGGVIVTIEKKVENKLSVSKAEMEDFIYSDKIPEYNPLEEWLAKNAPIHKGTSGELEKFADHLVLHEEAALDDDFKRVFFRKWFIGIMAQVFLDKAVNILMPILASDINLGKTHMMKHMIPDVLFPYMSNWMADTEQNVAMKLTTNLIVYNDEMSGMSKKSGQEFRQLISESHFEFRAPYDKTLEKHKKLASFIGTSNELDVIPDPAHNRRMAVFYLEKRDRDMFDTLNTDAMWVEAYEAFQAGETWELTEEEVYYLRNASKMNAQGSVELDAVQAFVVGHNDPQIPPLKSAEVFRELSSIVRSKSLNRNKVMEALRTMGFESKPHSYKGKAVRGYRVIVRDEDNVAQAFEVTRTQAN